MSDLTYENAKGTATLHYMNGFPKDHLASDYALVKATSRATGRVSSHFAHVKPKNATRAMAGRIRSACEYDSQPRTRS